MKRGLITRVGLVISLTACLLTILACVPQSEMFSPPALIRDSFVLIDTSESAYTVFVALTKDKMQEVSSQNPGVNSIAFVTRSELKHQQENHLSSRIVKNDYQGSRVVDGLLQLLDRYPGVPFALTWNGGVAITFNDYKYAKMIYESYMNDPDDYERKRVPDPRADPLRPEAHFKPLLGW